MCCSLSSAMRRSVGAVVSALQSRAGCFEAGSFVLAQRLCRLQHVDWASVVAKKSKPPLKPLIRHELDTRNFSEEFTQMTPVYSPAESPPGYAKEQDVFRVSCTTVSSLICCSCRSPAWRRPSKEMPFAPGCAD